MKNIVFVLSILVIYSCKKDKIDFDDDLVESIEVFSEIGGRSDWNSITNKILYDEENVGRYDLFICNPDKSNKVNLTYNMTDSTFGDQTVQSWQHRGQPAFHPTGEYLVFQVMNEHASSEILTDELLSLGVNNDLWFMKSDGSKIQKLTNNPAGFSVLHAHFSHSGDKIMWAEKYNDDESISTFGSWRIKLADISIDGDGNASLDNIQDLQPGGAKWYETHSFSADDSKIYFSGNLTTDLKANDIYSYDLNSEELINLTNSPNTWEEMYNTNPQNPNQFSYISSEFFEWNNTWGWATLRTELYINDGGEVKQLTYYNQLRKKNNRKLSKSHFFIGDHCWGPDGKTFLAVLAEAKVGNADGTLLKIKLK